MKTASNLRPASSPVALAGSLSDQQHLSDLIGVVYDAAIDPSLWENAIQRATYFVGGVGGGLFCKDVGAYHAASPHHFGFDPPLPAELFEGSTHPPSGTFSVSLNGRLRPPI